MNASTVVTMLIGLGIPALIAFVTKESLNAHAKVLLLLFLTTVSGALTAAVGNLPPDLNAWEHVAFNIFITFAAAGIADVSGWTPSGAKAAIHRASSSFGLGPPGKHARHHKSAADDTPPRW
jgi:hypothetical protein